MLSSSSHHSAQKLSKLSQQELIAIILRQQATQSNGRPADTSPHREKVHAPNLADQYDTFCRQIAENFPNGAVAILDRNLTHLHVAGEAMQRHGITREMLIGKPMSLTLPQQHRHRLQAEFQRVLRGERCLTDITIDGETYLVSASPLTSAHGAVDRILAVSQNITNRQVALRQSQESEAQFRTLAESIPGAVYLTTNDQERKVLYISQKITGLCGYMVKDFLESRVTARDLIHPDDWDTTEQAIAKALANKQSYRLTYRLRHREGHTCWIEEYGANVVKDGKKYFQGVLFDISEKKQYEEELQKQNEDLKRANAELDQFSYSVSHDLRAPLTSALGLIHLLKIEEDPAQRDQFIALAEQSLHQLNNFIHEIMSLTRNSRTDLTLESVELSEMVNEVITSQKQNADHDRVEVRNLVEPSVTLRTDRRRLRTILDNLISNAIRYHRPSHERPYVQVAATAAHQHITLRVEDNGIGIQEEYIGKIFDMFYRATNHVTGSGLGLYLVKETVQKLKGQIRVDSRVNQGSTFTVDLPPLK